MEDGKITRNRPEIELLAPAGSVESLHAAVALGADAVYMGGRRFGARAYAENPDEDGLSEAIDYCHLYGRKLYLTVNTLLKEEELTEDLAAYLTPYYERGVDAVLVQDLGVLSFLKRTFPDLELHISTQMTVASPWGASLAKRMGAARLVLPRELSLKEISRIRRETGMEVETFVHGALCYCYSGQCLMSSMIGGRSGNRGRCAQPCRLPFDGEHLLDCRDLCTLDLLPAIREAGVSSLKIEGRMKSPLYTAGVVEVYRRYLDRLMKEGEARYRVEESDREWLRDLFDRGGGFTEGYYRKHNGADMIYTGEKPKLRPVNEGRRRRLEEKLAEKMAPVPVRGVCRVMPGEPIFLEITDGRAEICVTGMTADTAASRPVTAEKIGERLRRTGETPFAFEDLRVETENAFVPMGALNDLRRQALETLEKEILHGYRRIS